MAADIQFNVDAALAKLGEMAQQHGPQVVDTAAQVVQINAAGNLAVSAAMGVCAATGVFGLYRLIRAGVRENAKDFREQNEAVIMAAIFGSIFGGVASVIMAGVAASGLLDVWNWIALVNPKLALAHAILAKLGGL